MLSILINNESVKKSYKKSQRILSKYLPQLGQRTYCGSISKEGLDNLEKDLKAISSRYMSISCLSIKNKHTHELLWVIGNKDSFDPETGVFAMKTKTLKQDSLDFIENKNEKYFNSLIKLAVLFHDLGKANNDFQNKLLKVVKSHQTGLKLTSYDSVEFFRHETISAFLVHFFFIEFDNKLLKNQILNEELIKECFEYSLSEIQKLITSNFNTTQNNFELLLEVILKDIKKLNASVNNNQIKNIAFAKLKNPVSNVLPIKINLLETTKLSVMWLVLTHHKLIGIKHVDKNIHSYDSYFYFNNDNSPFLNNFNYVQTNTTEFNKFEKQKDKKLVDNFTFSKIMPWQNIFWLKSVSTELVDLFVVNKLEEIQFNSKENINCYVSTLAHYCRPFLVFSDYLGSVIKNKKDAKKSFFNNDHLKENFANLDKNDFGDTLTSHLNIVKKSFRNASQLFKISKKEIDNEYFSYLDKNNTKILNEKIESFSPKKFEWQNIAYKKLLESKQSECASFTIVISETGSGKTLGGAKIMKALGEHKLRYTLALGLRTLTLQSGKSYREDLGLNEEQVGIIIGSEISQKLFEQNNVITGSDVLDQDNDNYIVNYHAEESKWKNVLNIKNGLYESSKLFDNQCAKIIEAPILVCTVDQLIGITNLNKVNKARILPRIFSADLILDEIDNYNPADLVHVGRLIYLYGLYGKKVVIMSATVSKVIINQLYEAYIQGIKVFNYLNDTNKTIKINFISNLTEPQIIDNNGINFDDFLNTYINEFSKNQKLQQPKLRLNKIIDINSNNWIEPIYNECKQLHNKFKNVIKINNQDFNISVGFIKFNNVGSARKMAYELLSREDNLLDLNENNKISILCYHSKYSTIELDNIEKQLNNIINRKVQNSFNNNEQINSIIQKNFTTNNMQIKNLIIIICTTSILEVGRDHDYDWSIIEPSTNKSVIQAAGRVLRHRQNDNIENRISILSTMIKDKEYNDAKDVWKNNGMYNYIKDTNKFNYAEKITFELMFDSKSYFNGIFTSIIFENSPNNYMKKLEDEAYNLYLNNSSNTRTLTNYTNKNELLNNYHYFYNKFRKKDSSSKKGYVKLLENWYDSTKSINTYYYNDNFHFSDDITNIQWKPLVALNFANLKKERIFLNKYLIQDIIIDYKTFSDSEINLLTTYDIEYYDIVKKDINDILDYHPLLGFNYKKII